jgi:4-amino-4-deoxy-L-arabinose transferase-like glycosyltransferase
MSRPALAWRWLLAIAALPLVALLACLSQYGWFRDELYYMVCASHPATGYVDQPPLSLWLLAAWRAIVGEHLAAIRVLPALMAPVWVVATAALARELGGERGAQVLAALAAAVVPTMLGVCHVYSMNAFDLVAWPIATLLFLRATETGSRRAWIGLGFALGLGLLNKLSVLWLGAGFAAALVLTSRRKALATPWPYVAALIAAAVASPYALWEVRNQFPTLEFMHNATSLKMVGVSPFGFAKEQFLSVGPWTLPLWAAGLVAGLVPRTITGARSIAIAYLAVVVILIAEGHSRGSYAMPAYPALLACGACAVERSLRGSARTIARAVLSIELLSGGVLGACLALPLLPVETYIAVTQRIGLAPSTEEHLAMGRLPQSMADMFGWQELADAVGRAYQGLSPYERAHCVIFGQNYGEASAAAVLGKKYGMPRVLSGHNSYWMWGPGDWNGEVMIVIGSNAHDNGEFFVSVEPVGTSTSPYAMPYEQNLSIFVCRKFKGRLADAWPRLKRFI